MIGSFRDLFALDLVDFPKFCINASTCINHPFLDSFTNKLYISMQVIIHLSVTELFVLLQ